MIALACACALLFPAHPQSLSSSRLDVAGAHVRLELRCQQAALIAALDLDEGGDGALDLRELEAAREEIEAYVCERYRVLPVDEDGRAEAPLAFWLERIRPALPDGAPDGEAWVEIALAARAAEPLGAFRAEVRLFVERDPLHRDTAEVRWNDEPPRVFHAGPGRQAWTFEPAGARRAGVLLAFARLGLEHILSGWDHLAFLAALLLAARHLPSLLATVTAFTAAHSLTLLLAAVGVVRVPARPVELAIALSIAYVALTNLVSPRSSSRWIEAFVFGLVHGLGFAGFLGESLLSEPLRPTALVGFNLGVEAGQLLVVVPLALALRALPGRRASGGEPATGRARLAPTWARVGGSAAAACAGLAWFAGRAGWL